MPASPGNSHRPVRRTSNVCLFPFWPAAFTVCRAGILSRRDALHVELIAARPFCFIFCFAIRASCDALYFLGQPGRTHDAYSPLTSLTTKNLLHSSSWQPFLFGGPGVRAYIPKSV